MNATKEYHRSLFQYAPDAILQVDIEDVIVFANPRASEMTGYSVDELKGMKVYDLFSEEELRRKPLRRDLLEDGVTVVNERDLLRKDGTTLTIEMNSVLTPEKVIWSFVRDISELKKQRKALSNIEKRYEVAFKTSPDSVAITDMNGTFVEVNQGFCEIFGWSVAEVIGRTAKDIRIWVDPTDRDRLFEIIDRDGRAVNFEARMRKKNGQEIYVLASFTKIVLDGVRHNMAIVRDISKRKKMEEELREAKQKAEESDRLKSTFLRNISHEIRTPMNAIMGFSELLAEDSDGDPTRKEYVGIIQERGRDLIRIIDDIIEVSKIEAGQVKYNFSKVCLADVLHSVKKNLIINRSVKPDLKLVFNCDLAKDIFITTDPEKLIRVFGILFSNGIKYTDTGEVRLTCRLIDDGCIEFVVKDTGIGISEENQALIFENFRRIEGDEAITRGGSGLGLSICRGFVEGLGGSISIASKIGEGSEFRFSIKSME